MEVPEWLTDFLATVSALDIVLWCLGAVAVIAFIKKGWPWLRRTAKAFLRFAEVVDSVQELPEFIERTDKTLEDQSAAIADIHHEVHFNNGSSVKDAVVRVERDVKRLLGEDGERGSEA